MSTIYTSGTWKPNPGSEDAFVAAWEEFAAWASTMPGAGRLQLTRDLGDPGRYLSFGDWDGRDNVQGWKTSPTFRDRLAHVLQHVDEFSSTEYALVAAAEKAAAVHYKHDAIAIFPVSPERVIEYMSSGGHPHQAFKSHRRTGIGSGVVDIAAEMYTHDGSIAELTIQHRLDPPKGIETTMLTGPFGGARFTHTYTPVEGGTKIDLEGDFPAMPGMSEADELAMIDGFFTMVFGEDAVTLATWEPHE
jgi:heme-degrading monooxygenase HmoA